MLKKRYENADLQIIDLATDDVIRTSQNSGNPEIPTNPRGNLLDIDYFG